MKVYVWGTGVILGRILDYRVKLADIIAFVDNNESKKNYMGKPVIQPCNIVSEDCDAIIVANSYAHEIHEQCKKLCNIDAQKLIFLYNNFELDDLNGNYNLIQNLFGEDYAKLIKSKYHLIRSVALDEVKPFLWPEYVNDKMYQEDYVRARTLGLAINEIKRKNISGAVAELGVYQGNFSKYINSAFPDRNLYLFDTFEGFPESEASKEKKQGNVNESFISAVKNTSVDYVLSKMQNIKKVIVRKGLFPASLNERDYDEQFAFVSLDVDFEDSTLAGLDFFYPRLSVGGYIFIHDYNYGYYDSVLKAVDKYEKKQGLSLCKVPLCDADGTLVITK